MSLPEGFGMRDKSTPGYSFVYYYFYGGDFQESGLQQEEDVNSVLDVVCQIR